MSVARVDSSILRSEFVNFGLRETRREMDLDGRLNQAFDVRDSAVRLPVNSCARAGTRVSQCLRLRSSAEQISTVSDDVRRAFVLSSRRCCGTLHNALHNLSATRGTCLCYAQAGLSVGRFTSADKSPPGVLLLHSFKRGFA